MYTKERRKSRVIVAHLGPHCAVVVYSTVIKSIGIRQTWIQISVLASGPVKQHDLKYVDLSNGFILSFFFFFFLILISPSLLALSRQLIHIY